MPGVDDKSDKEPDLFESEAMNAKSAALETFRTRY